MATIALAPNRTDETKLRADLLANRDKVIPGRRIVRVGRFLPGSSCTLAAFAVIMCDPAAPDSRAFSTHLVVAGEARGDASLVSWYGIDGNYDLTAAHADDDLATR